MKLYGIWVAQNEGDVIRDTLEFHWNSGLYERIFFCDLGSTDDTLAIARRYSDLLEIEQRRVPYSGALRVALIDAQRRHFAPGDWVAIIDSDEIYEDDPRRVIRIAEAEGATRVETWQAQFYFTDEDRENWEIGGEEFRSKSVFDRMRHYVVNWSEMRFYKYLPLDGPDRLDVAGGRRLVAPRSHIIDLDGKLASARVLNRHYPYRSPAQIQNKVSSRLENRRVGGNPQYQIFSEDWRKYVVDRRLLHRYDGRIRFGVPPAVDWKRFYNFWANDSAGWRSPAYNNVYIYWLMENGFLRSWSVPELALKAVGKAVQRVRRRDVVARP